MLRSSTSFPWAWWARVSRKSNPEMSEPGVAASFAKPTALGKSRYGRRKRQQPNRPKLQWKKIFMRTDYCGAIDTRYLQQTVTLYGWTHRRRDHGGVIFLDIRDREGLVQVVCD